MPVSYSGLSLNFLGAPFPVAPKVMIAIRAITPNNNSFTILFNFDLKEREKRRDCQVPEYFASIKTAQGGRRERKTAPTPF